MIGRVIGSYEVQARIGVGGMGSVWRGIDVMLDRPVAIKALRADIASDPQAVERFRQEARILARFLHPHIATLYALLRDGDDFFMVMEYVEGETFEELLVRQRALTPAHAVPLVCQALDGIEQAHHHGVIHRDIKPANLILTPGGTVKVMDFGIARLRGSQRMTRTHFTIGTAAYMAPEQIRSTDLDARADVYALGVLLYELVTGRVPFQSDSSFEVMQAHLQTPPPPPSEFAPDLPSELEQIILRTLKKKPDARFPSAAALHAALTALDLPPPPFDLATPTLAETPVPEEPVEPPPSEPPAPPSTPPAETIAETRVEDAPPAPLPEPDREAATVVVPPPPKAQDLDRTVLLSESPFSSAALPPEPVPGTAESATVSPSPPWHERHRRTVLGLAALFALLVISALLLTRGEEAPGLPDETPTEQPASVEDARPSESPLVPSDSAAPAASEPISAEPTASLSLPPADAPPPDRRPATEAQQPPRDQASERPPPRERPPPPGTVRILVRPFGDVYVDGQRLATGTNAPVTATLPPGRHRVRAVHPTLGTLERQVTIEPDQTREVLLEFSAAARPPSLVEITVLSDPVNAEILVDGEQTGRYTPATVRLTPGSHTIELRRRGHNPATRTITVTTGRPDRVFFNLTPR